METRATQRGPGRPRVDVLTRTEQLRNAKRAQRERDREQGLVLYQAKLHEPTAKRLRAAFGIPGFEEQLRQYLNEVVIDVDEFPNLKLLCWNRTGKYVADRDAFGLYERNWRFVDTRHLSELERALIDRLATKYGNGVLNV